MASTSAATSGKVQNIELAGIVLEQLSSAVVVYQGDGTVILANPRAQQILDLPDIVSEKDSPGAPANNPQLQHWFGFLPHRPPAPEPHDENANKDDAHQTHQSETDTDNHARQALPTTDDDASEHPERLPSHVAREATVQTPKGETVHVGYQVRPLRTDDLGEPCFLMIFRDIKNVLQLRDERDRYLRLATTSHVLATLAHEIKNPLAGIQNIVELLQEDLQDSPHNKDLQAIIDAVRRLRLIVDQVNLTKGQLRTTHFATDLVPVARNAIRIAEGRVQRRKVTITYQGPEQLNAEVHPDLLQVILINLLNNAIEATEAENAIEVILAAHEHDLHITITDQGHGMASDVLKRATELFFTTKRSGSGIGLALTQQILRRAGGELKLTSEPNQGTKATLVMPGVCRSQNASPSTAKTAKTAKKGTPS